MTLVVDASVLVSLLVDDGPDGRWSEVTLAGHHLVAPHLVLVETANVLRRAASAGQISSDSASLAHADLLDLSMQLLPYVGFGERVWELRPTLTAYDAWYVAVAEAVGAPLVTLDARLARASGPQCAFLTPAR